MTQREVQDAEHVTWTCVQALSGVEGAAAERAAERVAERMAGGEGMVPVVCTPSGGAETVRLELPRDWHRQMSDDELLAAIAEARGA